MSATLPPGTYDVNVFAHSVVAGTFNNVQTKRITVVAPASNPRMFIDLPVAEFVTTPGTLFTISGWALDLASPSGAGSKRSTSGPTRRRAARPIFVGATTLDAREMGRRRRLWPAVRRLRVFFTGHFAAGRL